MTDQNARDTGAGSPPSESLTPRQWTTLVVLTSSMFIIVLDVTVVLIALPAIRQDLGGSLDVATWVPGAFILTFAGLLLLFGKIADIYGRRRLFVIGMTVFTAASGAAALAPSLEFLIGARVVQGIGAAIVEPAIIAVIKATFPADRLGLAFGVEGQAAGLASVFGPIVGGLLTTTLGWEYIFVINVPIGIVAIAAASVLIPESRDEHISRSIDVAGAVCSGAGLFALVFAIVEGQRYGWASPPIIGAFVASVALWMLFIVAERRARNPLVDLELFRDRLFSVGCFLRGASEFLSAGIFIPLVFFLQTQLGYSPLQTGLLLLPMIAGALAAGPLAGAASDRVDLRWPIIPGFLLGAGGLFWLAHLDPHTSWTFFLAPITVMGAGLGALYGPTTSGSLRNIPTERSGIASAVSYAAITIGFELGIAVTSVVLQSQGGHTTPAEAANAAILACAAMAALGALAAPLFTSNRTKHTTPPNGTRSSTGP